MRGVLEDPSRTRGRTALFVAIGIGLVLSVVGLAVWTSTELDSFSIGGASGIEAELRDRGRIAIVGSNDSSYSADGAQLVVPEADLAAALAGRDEAALDEALSARGIAGVLVDGRRRRRGASIAARLSRYENVGVLSGVYLTPTAALYLRRRGLEVSENDGALLARAARQILGGARLPNVRSFPEPLRRSRSVEVLVVMRQGNRPRLWRSARGGSMARALITASSVARDRWIERETAMGGAIDDVLPTLSVDVLLLEEDGTIGDRSAAFLDRVITRAHGVAFEGEGSWHYLRPDATRERGRGSTIRAYTELFSDAGERTDSLERPELRLYRIVTRLVGTSPVSSSPLPPRSAGPSALEAFGPPALEGASAGGAEEL